MKQIINNIIFFILSGVIFVVLIYMFVDSSDKEMKVRCIQYQQYQKEFAGFWISAHDKVACDDLGIIINAPVH